ncbi:hypothetical protein JCM33374_g2243 [Metschnikowia sp. JCM 33374]|nr:hypothetical protein JCM33374_g2243 [Metschnikowia sp. JCM 33374]
MAVQTAANIHGKPVQPAEELMLDGTHTTHTPNEDHDDGGSKPHNSIRNLMADAVISGGGYMRVTVWGAFAYGSTWVAQELMNQCNICWQHHRNSNGNCAVDLSQLASAVAVSTIGGLVGAGVDEQKD